MPFPYKVHVLKTGRCSTYGFDNIEAALEAYWDYRERMEADEIIVRSTGSGSAVAHWRRYQLN